MQQNKLANFSETARLKQNQKFEEKLMDILEMDKDCQGTYCFLELEGTVNVLNLLQWNECTQGPTIWYLGGIFQNNF